ncbi:1192_t:CDS:2 [Gigaspora margarita]|uniref:1192_t:CDS:1 n=1 Tax=Gigaspora margarita TaxID=4874 RepID=A0ABN7VGU4_GIGMA|nr:1192_t:CDS:2 [Gigaspora margarita]
MLLKKIFSSILLIILISFTKALQIRQDPPPGPQTLETSQPHQTDMKDSKNTKLCPRYMLTATNMDQYSGQMTFYQDTSGHLWSTGLYQNGFDPADTYSFSIVDGCSNYLYNLTGVMGLEPSMCSSCASSSSHYKRRMGRRHAAMGD